MSDLTGLLDTAIQGGAQGAGLMAVLALYLDRRLSGIETGLKELASALRGKPPGAPT